MKDMVGVPAPFVVLMRLMPWILAQARGRRAYASVRRRIDDCLQDSTRALLRDWYAGVGHERDEDLLEVEGRRAGDRGSHSRRALQRAGRTDAQREAGCPDTGGC